MSLKINGFVLKQIICFAIIKYVYTFVTVTSLEKLYYPGSGGYFIDYNWKNEIVASIVFFLVAFYYSCRKLQEDFKSVVLHLLFIMYYIPINAAYVVNSASPVFFILTTIYFLLIITIFTHKRYKSTKAHLEHLLYDQRVLIFCFCVCVVWILYKIYYNGFTLNLSIDGNYVYANRAEYNEKASRYAGTLFSYVITLLSNVESSIAPLYLFLSLKRKKILPASIALLAILSEYSLNSMKGTLFGAVLVFGIYFCYRYKFLTDYRKFFNISFVGFMAVCLAEKSIRNLGSFYYLFIRRVMYTPAALNVLYYDFFRKNYKVLLTDCVFGLQRILPHVHDTSPLTLISEAYYGGTMPSPNTGLFGAAYMQLGVIGVILQPLLLFLIMNWAGKTLQDYGKGVVIVVAINTVLKLQNVPILRTDFILSFVVYIAVLKFLPKVCFGNKNRRRDVCTAKLRVMKAGLRG